MSVLQARKGAESFAVKVINKRKFMNLGGTVDAMFKEVEVMNNLAHPNVIDIKDVFNTPSYLVLVLELCVVSRCPRWLLVRTWPADWLRLACMLLQLQWRRLPATY